MIYTTINNYIYILIYEIHILYIVTNKYENIENSKNNN